MAESHVAQDGRAVAPAGAGTSHNGSEISWAEDTVPIVRPDERIWPEGIRPYVDRSAATARVSTPAILGASLSLIALCAVLAGLLGATALALAVPGVLFSIIGVAGATKPGEAGRGFAGLGLVCGFIAVMIAIWA